MLALLLLLLTTGLSTECESRPVSGPASVCEVRTFTLGARDALTVRNPVSGSIRIEAWDRGDIGVRAEVRAYETNGQPAERFLRATTIETEGTLQAVRGEGGWVETQFVLFVPRDIDLDLSTNNGAITVSGVTGTLHIDTNNGSVRLTDIGGTVDARSNNGDVLVDLGGATWSGDGLRAFANNGALTLRVPESYDAIVEAEVRWGYINEPDALSPAAETKRVYFGAGGPTLRVSANSGSVQIERG
ncbi:MAG: DUF4097 family beta strand repeat-containing protein [Bacteroidota bacterium]